MTTLAIIITIIKFIFSAIGVFSTCLFLLSTVNSIINPTFQNEEEKNSSLEKYDNFRLVSAIVMSICWGIVIAL